MMMTMQHELGAVLGEHVAKRGGVGQPAKIIGSCEWRMMDQHDAKHLLAFELCQEFAKTWKLVAVQAPSRGERQRRQRGGKADQRQRPPPPEEREALAVVAAHEVGPMALRELFGRTHVGIVVSGHHRY